MPISSQVPIIGYVANGVTKSFAFPFAILSADDLKVKVGADVVTTGFSIAGVGDRDGGSVTFTDAPASLTPIILYREVALDRTTDYQENGDLLAIVLDDDLDRIWMALQDQLLLADRAVRTPIGETLQELPPASERALMALAFDAAGNPIVVRGTNDGGAALALDLMDTAPGKGAALLGYDGGTAQDVLDEAKPMANYTALRAYTGRATGVRITQSGLSGFFQRDDTDTISADNGGTVIVDAGGRRWKRLFAGHVNVKWFDAVGDGVTDNTPAFDAATAAIKAVSLPGGATPPALIVPAGIYNIDRILIGHSNFKMVCEPGAMFKWRGGASSIYPYFIYPDNLASSDFADFYKNIEIDGLRIDPATIATGKSVIRIGNMYAGVIKNCHIEDDGFGADTTKLALDIANGSYKWSIENCTLPRMRCEATTAWNVTTIAFRSVGGRRLQLKNALGVTAQGLILEGDEADKISLEEVNGFTNIGGDFEGGGTLYAFVGQGNTNIHSIGNDTTALTGSYTSGTVPTKSSFNDRGFPGFGFPNLNGDAAQMLVRRVGDGRVLRVDSDTQGNLCVDLPSSGYVHLGPADDRISRLVAGAGRAASLSWQENKLGFFSAGPIEKPAGVAVTAAGIHAALVALGLISP